MLFEWCTQRCVTEGYGGDAGPGSVRPCSISANLMADASDILMIVSSTTTLANRETAWTFWRQERAAPDTGIASSGRMEMLRFRPQVLQYLMHMVACSLAPVV